MAEHRRRTHLQRAAALLLSSLIAVGLGELTVFLTRLDVLLLDPLVGLQSADPDVHRQSADPELLYELAPDVDTVLGSCSEYAPAPRTFTTNTLGLRDEPRQLTPPPGTLRLVCLGGSNTYGAAVSDHQTWPAQLQQVLRERTDHPVEVWNAGVAGYMNRQKAALGTRLLAEARPDLILVQVHNMGRRYRLMNADLADLLATSPGVYAENLERAPDPGSGRAWTLFRVSGLWRSTVIGFNRYRCSTDRDAWSGALGEAEDARGVAAIDDLARACQGRAGLVIFVPPPGYGTTGLRDLGLPLIDLTTSDFVEDSVVTQPFGDEGVDPHPGPRVYRWYAEQLADRLIGGECLDHPTDCSPRLPDPQDPGDEEGPDGQP